uniref:Beta-microseminoprotein n=1 Tax=Chelydra serpentina TaxID=8475 RepID=A0A8C3RZF3_CHESE
MKTLFCLTVLCASLAVCHGACYLMNNDAQIKEGELVRGCVDHFDKSEHPIGATWNSHQCLSCTCEETTISCCTRYGGVVKAPEGCEAILDEEQCEYKIHKKNDPSAPCIPF